ncbi:MAG: LamG domain-containing protein, partial [Sedimentisphaerales bacterium]|nr:LamG domain-containing protein [Sedimentisphaerales bacterium]
MRTNMKTIGLMSIMALTLGFCLAGPALAIDVPITDASFEDAAIPNGSWSYVNYNSTGWWCSSGAASGSWMGRNYVNGYGYPQVGHNSPSYTEFNNQYCTQALDATYEAGLEYTLTVWATVHNYADPGQRIYGYFLNADGYNLLDPMPVNATTTLYDSGPNVIPDTSTFNWYKYEFTYVATSADDGSKIGIAFWGDGETNFDDVSLVAQPPVVMVLPNLIDIAEGGATDTYDITLLKDPNDGVAEGNPGQAEVTVSPDAQSDVGAGAGVAIVLTFTAKDIPQTVTVTAVDDTDLEGDHDSIITNTVSSADLTFNGIVKVVTANITDNDVPGVTITETPAEPNDWTYVDEAGTIIDSYTIVLDSKMQADDEPGNPDPNDVEIIVEPNQYDGTPQDDVRICTTLGGTYVPGTITLTFTKDNWNTPQTIYVKGVQDAYVEPFDIQIIRHIVVDNGTSYDASIFTAGAPDVTVYIGDDDGTYALNDGIRLLLDYEDAQLGLDTSGSGANGRPFGDPTAGTGKMGNGLVLDGDDYLSCSDPNVLQPTKAITLASWVKADDFNAYAAAISNLYDSGSVESGYFLGAWTSGNYAFTLEGATNGQVLTGQGVADQWNHLVGTFDGTTVVFYINGVPVAFAARSVDINHNNPHNIDGTSIGRFKDNNEDERFPGTLDQTVMWDRALGITEVLALYNAGAGTALSGKEGIIIRESGGTTDVSENSAG